MLLEWFRGKKAEEKKEEPGLAAHYELAEKMATQFVAKLAQSLTSYNDALNKFEGTLNGINDIAQEVEGFIKRANINVNDYSIVKLSTEICKLETSVILLSDSLKRMEVTDSYNIVSKLSETNSQLNDTNVVLHDIRSNLTSAGAMSGSSGLSSLINAIERLETAIKYKNY